MSAITDNFSQISNQNRSRINSKFNRHYQKVSETNLDHKTIVSYLKSHRLFKTLAIFTSQSQYTEHIEPIIEILNNGSQSFEGNILDLIKAVKKEAVGKENVSSQKMIIIQFLTYIWYSVGKKELNKSRLTILKDYIDKNGQILAEIPELLPYFALPYFDQPSNHPLFKKIVTAQWRQQLVSMICQTLAKITPEKVQMEWLNIIKDLVQICSNFYNLVPIERKTKDTQTGYQRVKQYKKVIQSNMIEETEKPKPKPLLEPKLEVSNLKDLKNVKQTLLRLHKDVQQKGKLSYRTEISKIYHKMQVEIVSFAKQNKDKEYAKQLIRHNILLFDTNINVILDIQNLKLLQILTAYYQGRTYLQQHLKFIHKIADIIAQNFKERNNSDYNREMIYICLDILQKAVIRRPIFDAVITVKGFLDLLLKFFLSQKSEYLKGSQQVQYEITANTALLMQIIMHRKGRYVLASTMLFQNLIELVQKMKSRSGDEVLQKAICSCIYLLLVEPHIRARAQHARLKDKLLNRMMIRTNSNYENIVGYIIERMSIQGQIQEGDSDEDVQKSIEYDQTIVIKQDEIWQRKEVYKFQQHKQNKSVNREQKKKDEKRYPAIRQNFSKQRAKKSYSKDKYNWKKNQ